MPVRTESELKLLILIALTHFARNDLPAGRKTLLQALTLAEPNGYRRLFLDEGAPMVTLLQDMYPHLDEQAPAMYVRILLLAFAEEPAESTADLSGLI